MKIELLTVIQNLEYTIQATHYFDEAKISNKIIFYFHGGGLIFGKRDDLPKEYIDRFIKAGYSLVTIDYLLAPESKLNEIIEILSQTINILIKNSVYYFKQKEISIIFLGRSAGAYLAILLANKLQNLSINALILFYGYYTLKDANFLYQNRQFSHYPKVNKRLIQSLIANHPISNEPNPNRYLIYLDARLNGTWINYVLEKNSSVELFSLTKTELMNLPPTLLIHSNRDPDVPYRQSVQMNQSIRDSHLITIESNEHDFDRTDIRKGNMVYQKVIEWLTCRI